MSKNILSILCLKQQMYSTEVKMNVKKYIVIIMMVVLLYRDTKISISWHH